MQTVNMPGGGSCLRRSAAVMTAPSGSAASKTCLGLPQVWKYHYTPGMHESNSMLG